MADYATSAVSDESLNDAVRAYIQAGKRGLDLQEAMRCAIEAAISSTNGEDTVPSGVLLNDADWCAIEFAGNALRSIAERSFVSGDVIERVDTIGAASKRAAAALARLQPVLLK